METHTQPRSVHQTANGGSTQHQLQAKQRQITPRTDPHSNGLGFDNMYAFIFDIHMRMGICRYKKNPCIHVCIYVKVLKFIYTYHSLSSQDFLSKTLEFLLTFFSSSVCAYICHWQLHEVSIRWIFICIIPSYYTKIMRILHGNRRLENSTRHLA